MWIVEPDSRPITPLDERDILIRARVPSAVYDATQLKRQDAEIAALTPVAAAREGALRIVPPLRSYDPFNPPVWPSYLPLHAGNQSLDPHGCGFIAEPVVTVNGGEAPQTLSVLAGRPQLLRILNALPNGMKYIRMHDASGAVQTLHVVARDGVPVSNDDVLLTLKAGQSLTLYSDRHCVSPFGGVLLKHDLLTISASSAGATPPAAGTVSLPLMPAESRALRLVRYARSHPELVHRRALTYTQYEFPNAEREGVHFEFYITETSNRDFHEQPYWPAFAPGTNIPAHADVVVKQGTIEEWYLFNATPEMHTFHIHQMAFASEDETPAAVMLDTVVIPPGRMVPNPGEPVFALVKPSRTRILLDFRHVPRGEFVYHCHLLLHEDNGMMGVIRVT